MSHDQLLTDLCAICHVNGIKYTCPRCGIHTCSLPCVKQHKTWAQCSGIRNPAEYRKRSELATDSSIDKDFNFITSVERSIAKAETGVGDRGIDIAPARKLAHPASKTRVEREIEERSVKVIKAPKGLSRAKQNKTRWAGQQQCLMWTTEWILPHGERVTNGSLETRTIDEAFSYAFGRKKVDKKRKLAHIETSTHVANQVKVTDEETEPTDDPSERHFYLHCPTTISKFKCLRPLKSDQSIREAITGKTVLEYPTFYVLRESPADLKEPFLLDDDYQQKFGEQIFNIAHPLEEGEVEEPDDVIATLPSGVDSQKVAEVLAQDLGN